MVTVLDKPTSPDSQVAFTEVPARPMSLIPLLVGAIFLLALALRVYCLDCHGFWGDEINSLDGAGLGFPDMINDRFGWISNQTPLHYLILWLTMQPVDPTVSTVLVRLPSALAGSLSVIVVYGLGRETFGRGPGLLAAVMLALSAVHLNHSQELRLYAMLVFLSSLSIYSLLRADRTGSGRWWAAFSVVTIANMANAYVAVTLFMPTLSLYMAWVLWKAWSRRQEEPRRLQVALLSMVVVALGFVAVVLDMLGSKRAAPDLRVFSLSGAVGSMTELLAWFTRFGLDGSLERLIQIGLLLLALFGIYLGLRGPNPSPDTVFLCSLFLVIPPILLLVFSSTTVVFQRYALFSMPIYYLLIGNGVLGLLGKMSSSAAGGVQRPSIVRWASLGLAAAILLTFSAGTYNYFSVDKHLPLTYRPDFRSAARYLSQRVSPLDTIVFFDDPGLGYTITNYYWKNKPPASAYDARDPRLFSHAVKGDIYWVISWEDLDVLNRISAPAQGWAAVTRFERVAVLREAAPRPGMLSSMESIVSKFEAIAPAYQSVVSMRGCLYQARGDTAMAAATYKRAGTYFPVGDDYLRTGEGFDVRGDEQKAWREAFISKFWQPARPEVHEWLAGKLMATGYLTESKIERALAQALQ